jgi:hypothetical protein
MEIEIVVLYGFLIYKIAVSLAPKVRRFSLRDLLLLVFGVAVVLFFIGQRGPAVMFLLVTIISVTLALVRVSKSA